MRKTAEVKDPPQSEPKRKMPRGVPFVKGDPRAFRGDEPVQDLPEFARDLLRSKPFQRALRKRALRGALNPGEIRALKELADEAPRPLSAEKIVYQEVLAGLKRLSNPEVRMLHALDRKMLGKTSEDEAVRLKGYGWRLVRRPGSEAGTPPPDVAPPTVIDPLAEKDLDPDRPLAAASERLRLAEQISEVGPRIQPSQDPVVVVVRDTRPPAVARLQDALRREPRPDYESWRAVPVSSPRPEDRSGNPSQVRCGKCGSCLHETRDEARKHDEHARDGKCRGASFQQI